MSGSTALSISAAVRPPRRVNDLATVFNYFRTTLISKYHTLRRPDPRYVWFRGAIDFACGETAATRQ